MRGWYLQCHKTLGHVISVKSREKFETFQSPFTSLQATKLGSVVTSHRRISSEGINSQGVRISINIKSCFHTLV